MLINNYTNGSIPHVHWTFKLYEKLNLQNITWFIVIRWIYNYILMCLLIKMLKILVQQTTVMNQIASMQLQNLIPTQDFLIYKFSSSFLHFQFGYIVLNTKSFHYNTFHSLILKLYQKGWSNWSQNVIFILEHFLQKLFL